MSYIGICHGLEMTENTFMKIRAMIPKQMQHPYGMVDTLAVTMLNPTWNSPLVIVGLAHLTGNMKVAVHSEINFDKFKQVCQSHLSFLIPVIDSMSDEERPEFHTWFGDFESVAKV